MSQKNVEKIIGLLATNEGVRKAFALEPGRTLKRLADGMELTRIEMDALSRLNPEALERFADRLDARIQKVTAVGDDARVGDVWGVDSP